MGVIGVYGVIGLVLGIFSLKTADYFSKKAKMADLITRE